jgi:hypothetical protein
MMIKVNAPDKDIYREYLKRKAHRDIMRNMEALTTEDHKRYTFAPLIITEAIWFYTQQSAQYCKDNKLSEFSKISRRLSEMRKEYDNVLDKSLGSKNVQELKDRADEWLDSCAGDLQILYFECTNQVLKHNPDMSHPYMRAYAWVALVFADFLSKHLEKCDKVIGEKLNKQMRTTLDENTIEVVRIASMYAGHTFADIRTFRNTLKIIEKRLSLIRYMESPVIKLLEDGKYNDIYDL